MNRFPYGRTVVLGFGFLGISLVWPIFNQFIPIFLQAGNPAFAAETEVAGFGLSPALALFIMTWDNLINVFVQPWVGERSDRTWNRFGRRKGWILLGVPVAVIGFVQIPLAPTALAIAVFILITNVGMALFRSPTVAWLGDLFKPEQRSQANGVINLMGGVGGLLALRQRRPGGAVHLWGHPPGHLRNDRRDLCARTEADRSGRAGSGKRRGSEKPGTGGRQLGQEWDVRPDWDPAVVHGLQRPGSRAVLFCGI